VKSELDQAGAVLLDHHFVYKSGKHGSGYINMDPLFPNVALMDMLGRDLAWPFRDQNIDAFAGPATGGILLAYAAATAYNFWCSASGQRAAAIWADKDGADFAFERAGFLDHVRGKRVLLVEDLLTTGGSVAKVGHEVERHGGNVVGVSVICNRGGVTEDQVGGYPLTSLLDVDFVAVDPDRCELCAQAVPIVTDVGHGDDYQKQRPNYPGGYEKLLS
jgi:orotate phosphoribosyltransferase